MITEINMYWLTRLDGIYNLCTIGCTICCAALIFMIPCLIMFKCDENAAGTKITGKMTLWTVISGIFFTAGLLFIPTTKEMAAIYAIPAIARSEAVQKDIPELYEAGMEYIISKVKTGD